MQRGFQRIILRLQRHRHLLPLQQLGVLFAQLLVFLAQREEMADFAGAVLGRLDRAGDQHIGRRQHVIQASAQPVGEILIRPADENAAERDHQHHRQGQTRQGLAERDR
ncbi:hypothetical protein GT370_13540 [Acidocella sp. MX-AZ03]|uniref:hypothetical protein n=1 Tax=Acidocella sp. MX-AZ03 TaxID=2697363 RepID=UPI0022DD725F|nr:hypothetical protein [Acidocella sp. MX-AZ03]WBO58235.1 hypothetical protein GT370_13540 [Acidocella sp. MX-AZ03]